ncbi:MAG TPA: hypothetical protein VFO77_16055 [Actinoplanes sp.]|nr:hypothetical protein [Actinoplanes sp.]
MQLGGVRRKLAVAAGLTLPALTGCAALGLGAEPVSAPASLSPGDSWVIVQQGKPSASPTPPAYSASPSASPTALHAPSHSACPADWSGNKVLIPITVEAGSGSLTATWPAQGDSDYRITAVPQLLVAGEQPEYTWQAVAPATGCTVTATITGLTADEPYIIWLDAPSTGYDLDGTRNPYSGRSGVVYPQ